MNLAIAAPTSSTYSETFIHMQMERLACRLRIHGGPVASETVPGGPIAPLRSAQGIVDTIIEVGLRHTRWEGPQRRELKRRLRRAGVQVLLANYGPTGVALLRTCEDLSIPMVVHFHGYDAHRIDVVSENRESYRRLGTSARAVIAVSNVMAQALQSYGIPKGKIHVVRCGADPACFRDKAVFPDTPMFFGVGRFVDKKAPYLTVLAFKQVHQECPSARLVLAGDGMLLEATQNLVRSLAIDSAVEFPGVLTPQQVAEYMRTATAFVQHSLMPRAGPSKGDCEGTPVAVLEAMLTGLPVVSTRHTGIAEVIEDGRSGLLVEERDVDGMAQAMLQLVRNPTLARALGTAAREEALEKYTAKHYINSLQEILAAAS